MSLQVGLSEKVQYLTLDLLKSFSLWTTYEREDVRLQAEIWSYWKNPLKQEKDPHKWSTIKYNSINTGPSQNILWSNSSIEMWSTSWDWKTGYLIKAGPTGKFLWNKRNTCISRRQSKIKSEIMAYRWTFGKDLLKLEKGLSAIHNNRLWCDCGPSGKVLYRICQKLSD